MYSKPPIIFAAITSLKEQVEATQELDQSVEILIRLLCAVPGWSEKNVQVITLLLILLAGLCDCFSTYQLYKLKIAGSAAGY